MDKKIDANNVMPKSELMKKLEIAIKNCKHCDLWKTRRNPVLGEGSLDAKILFVGEAPGFNEDRQGKPFVGKAGAILDQLLDSVGLKRQDIYITNILKCRPPQNRDPFPHEIKSCSHYLNNQIETIKPEKICCLGNFAASFIMKKFGLQNKLAGISLIRGKTFAVSTLAGQIEIIPLYHPAVATYNAGMVEPLKKDFSILKKT